MSNITPAPEKPEATPSIPKDPDPNQPLPGQPVDPEKGGKKYPLEENPKEDTK